MIHHWILLKSYSVNRWRICLIQSLIWLIIGLLVMITANTLVTDCGYEKYRVIRLPNSTLQHSWGKPSYSGLITSEGKHKKLSFWRGYVLWLLRASKKKSLLDAFRDIKKRRHAHEKISVINLMTDIVIKTKILIICTEVQRLLLILCWLCQM